MLRKQIPLIGYNSYSKPNLSLNTRWNNSRSFINYSQKPTLSPGSIEENINEQNQTSSNEKFMVVGSGEATCESCGFYYKPENGDSYYQILPDTPFENLPADWKCPTCGASKENFKADVKVYAGFAENQQFGLGTNSMTSEQKSLLIYGSLLFLFALFIGGYFLD